MTVYERVAGIVARTLKVPADSVSLDATQEDFAGWDSLQHLALIMAVEADFRCKFTLKEMTELRSIRAFVELVTAKTGHAVRP